MKQIRASLENITEQYVEHGYLHDAMRSYASAYEKNGKSLPVPVLLRALSDLCRLGEYHELDCTWLHQAMQSEIASKNTTSLKNFYLGGFVHAMLRNGASLNKTKEAVSEWLCMSPRQVENCYYYFRDSHDPSSSATLPILMEVQIIEIASAVINNVNRPFPGFLQEPFIKLVQSIEEHNLGKAALPFKHQFRKQ
jgi:hypothetical protein